MAKEKIVAKKVGDKVTVIVDKKSHTVKVTDKSWDILKDAVKSFNEENKPSVKKRILILMTPKTSAKKVALSKEIKEKKKDAKGAVKSEFARKEALKALEDKVDDGFKNINEQLAKLLEVKEKTGSLSAPAPTASESPRRGER